MSDPRTTEFALRNHLDSHQAMRERLCVALLPLLGPFTQVRPRRPRGGPDGGRDIEAVYQGSTTVWGAVGFRNGGGNDSEARRNAQEKFSVDLTSALKENTSLAGFVFFTNVDLTPTMIEEFKADATSRGVIFIDVFDFERLLGVLNSPEGLLARLQYLNVPMTEQEQLALISKFGNQLQDALLSRFDRVEQTLAELQLFVDLQKPIHRIDAFVALQHESTSKDVGEEAMLLSIEGLLDPDNSLRFFYRNAAEHDHADQKLIVKPYAWSKTHSLGHFGYFHSTQSAAFIALSDIRLTRTLGHVVRVVDLTHAWLTFQVTERLATMIKSVRVDVNGYELFDVSIDGVGETVSVKLPSEIGFDAMVKNWVEPINRLERDIVFDPLRPSNRYARVLTSP